MFGAYLYIGPKIPRLGVGSTEAGFFLGIKKRFLGYVPCFRFLQVWRKDRFIIPVCTIYLYLRQK